MFMSVNGKRKSENGKVKAGSGKVFGVFGLLGLLGVFRFDFSVRLSQRLYVVYDGIRAVQQVLAQFLEELLAGTGLYV